MLNIDILKEIPINLSWFIILSLLLALIIRIYSSSFKRILLFSFIFSLLLLEYPFIIFKTYSYIYSIFKNFFQLVLYNNLLIRLFSLIFISLLPALWYLIVNILSKILKETI